MFCKLHRSCTIIQFIILFYCKILIKIIKFKNFIKLLVEHYSLINFKFAFIPQVIILIYIK